MEHKHTEVYSFCNDNYMLSWQLGVAHYMQARDIFSKKAVFTGYGTGQLTAIALACQIKPKAILQAFRERLEACNKNVRIDVLWNSFDIESILEYILNETSAALATKHLMIPVMTLTGEYRWLSKFESNADIIAAHKASVLISSLSMVYLCTPTGDLTVVAMPAYPVYHAATLMIGSRPQEDLITDTYFSLFSKYPNLAWSHNIPKNKCAITREFTNGYNEARNYFHES